MRLTFPTPQQYLCFFFFGVASILSRTHDQCHCVYATVAPFLRSRVPKRRDKLPLTNKTPIPKRKKEIKKDSAHGEDDDDVLCAAPGEQQRQWRLSPGSWKRSRRASLFMHQCGDAAITIYHQRDVHHASHRRARRKNMMMGISIRPAPQGA